MADIFDTVAEEPRDIFDEVSSGDVFDQVAPEPSPIQLDPIANSIGRAQMQTGLVNPMSDRNMGEAISPQEQQAIKAAPGALAGAGKGVLHAVIKPLAALGQVVNAQVQDQLARVSENVTSPSVSGLVRQVLPIPGENIRALWNQQSPDEKLPFQEGIADYARNNPVSGTAAKVASSTVEMAPMAAMAMPAGVVGKLVSLGFTTDMLEGAGEASSKIGYQLGLPPEQRDVNELTDGIAELSMSAPFAVAAGYHTAPKWLKDIQITSGDARRLVIREVAEKLAKERIGRTKSEAVFPQRELGIQPVTAEPFLQPGVPQLADAALAESRNVIQTPTSGQALQALRGTVEGVEPVASPNRVQKENVAGGQISFAAPAEAKGIPNARQAAINPPKVEASVENKPAVDGAEEAGREARVQPPADVLPATPVPSTPSTKIVQAPEPESFNSVDEILKFRSTRLKEERDLYKEQIGLNDEQAQKLQDLLSADRETTKFEKTLTPEQQSKLNEFFDGPFNQKSGPFKSWETDPRLNPESIAVETDADLLSSAIISAVGRDVEPNISSDKFLGAAIAARRMLELGKTKSDLARYLDRYTTRNSGSAGDKAEFFKSLGGKIQAFLDSQGIKLPEGELGKKTLPAPEKSLTPTENFYEWSKGKDLNAEQARLAKELPPEEIQKNIDAAKAEADALRAVAKDEASITAYADAANKLQFWNETAAKSKSAVETKTPAASRSVDTDPNIGRTWNSPYGKQTIVSVEAGKPEFGIEPLYEVATEGKSEVRRYRAGSLEEIIKRDEHRLTPEYAKEQAEQAETNRLRAERDARQAAAKAKVDAEIAEFTKDQSPMAAGKTKAALEKEVSNNGVILTRKALVEKKVAAGAKVKLDNGVRILENPDGSFLGEGSLTKSGMDYAEHLLSKPSEPPKTAVASETLPTPAEPAPSVGAGEQKVRVGKSPQLHTILRETTDPKFPTEKIFEVRNDRTGEKFEVDEASIQRVTERAPEAKTPARDLDAELRAAKLDPSSFPDNASKKSALKRQKGLIDNIESLQARIRGKGGDLKMGVPAAILDTALEIARVALIAGKSVKDAVDAAVKHIRANHKGEFLELEARRTLMAELERQPVQSSGGAGGSTTPPTANRAPAATPAPARTTLDDVYKIFEPKPKAPFNAGKSASNIIEAVRTGFSSKFRPINKLAEDIAKAYGLSRPKDIAGIFEQLKGSQGKGEAEVYRFDRDVSSLVKGSEKDFNAYMFLRRTLDRLSQDAADVAAGGVSRRQVSGRTEAETQAKLNLLESNLGPEKVAKFQEAADKYQAYMDKALRLQVESGRMSQEVYDAIKNGNQFYAPFKVMKYLEETSRPEGVGSKVDTMADFTKAMQGISDTDLKLGDMLGAARQSILISRILADKNMAMRKVAELAPFDPQGLFIKRIPSGADAPLGMQAVNVLEGGKQVRYAVNPDVAQALQIYGGTAGGILSKTLSLASIPFRAGATALNIPFQVSNLMADIPRQALISKYGIKHIEDLVKYPLDFVQSLYSSMAGDLLGRENKLFQDFLDSGVAGTTIQEYLTPNALRFVELSNISKSKVLAKSVLTVLPRFAEAIEQTTKILGVKRAMRFEGVNSGAELAKQIPEAITELRRYSGSPDFGRQGKWTEGLRLNLLYMFLNARIQGLTADLGRLGGKDGPKTTAVTWARLMAAVGIPTAYLYSLNSQPENKADYEKRPLQERQNYWLIPKTNEDGSPRYVTTEDGEKIRDYWRIPKRESSKWIANYAEAALNFAEKRDKKAFGDFANSMIQEISPVNISGENATEKLESVGSGLNPLIKAPLELATGRDLYRHREIMSEQLKKASPEQQYNDRTAEAFKTIAEKMPDVAPEFLRSPIILENLTRNLTAGLATQFLPRKPVEGRTARENNPLLQRFQSLPYSDQRDFREQMTQLERNAADEQLTRHRAAVKLMDENKGKQLQEYAAKAGDVKTLQTLVDLYVAKQNGATASDRQVLSLPTHQRAMFVLNAIEGLPQDKKNQMILDMARKRILTENVLNEMATILKEK